MNKKNIYIAFYLFCLFSYPISSSSTEKEIAPVQNNIFKEQCGACHFAYQPALLPERSWRMIISKLPSHFGEQVILEEKEKTAIIEYLKDNAADRSSAKRAKKIIRSIKENTPLRITEIPYIQEKHRKIEDDIFSLPSIGSRSNCIACHRGAEQGNYDDDLVKIPK